MTLTNILLITIIILLVILGIMLFRAGHNITQNQDTMQTNLIQLVNHQFKKLRDANNEATDDIINAINDK